MIAPSSAPFQVVMGAMAAAFLAIPALPDVADATPPMPPPLVWPAEGLAVATGPGEQFIGDVVADGEGGMYIAWIDESRGPDEIDLFVQRVHGLGRIAWQVEFPAGRPLSTAPGRQFLVRLATDGADGVIAAWHDERNGSPDIYALRVTGDGSLAPGWPADGLPICAATGTQTDPVVASDGAGGAYIAWEDFRNGFNNGRIYAQRVLASGAVANGWPVDGARIANGTGVEFQPAILADGAGGAYAIWVRYWLSGTNTDLIAARLTPNLAASPGWADSGLVVCAAPGRQDSPSPVPDPNGGFYTAWRDYRDDAAASDIYAQRVSAAGEFPAGWGGYGLPVCVAPSDERIPKAASDGVGGLLVSWENPLSGSTNVFVQRLTADGSVAPGWDPAGVPTGTTTAEGQGPALVGDGRGGAYVAWDEYDPATQVDVYAQHIGADGTRAVGWAAPGSPIATAPDNQQIGGGTALVSSIVSDASGGAVIAWMDWGRSGDADILAQRVTAAGVVGPQSCYGCDGIVSVSPNPGRGRFRLEVRGPRQGSTALARVYDVAGRLRHEQKFSGLRAFGISPVELDLSGMPTGIYFLRYDAGGSPPIEGKRRLVLVR